MVETDNVLAVGPLVLQSEIVNGVEEVKMGGVRSGLLEEDPLSLTWLDGQKPSSGMFVSFSSIATVSVEQMSEYAAGLEASNVPFLWMVRSDLIADLSVNEEFETMFAGFVKRTQDRARDMALLVSWAPQTAVLSHPAVGAFLSLRMELHPREHLLKWRLRACSPLKWRFGACSPLEWRLRACSPYSSSPNLDLAVVLPLLLALLPSPSPHPH